MTSPRSSQLGSLVRSRLPADPVAVHWALMISADDALCAWVEAALSPRGWRVRRARGADRVLRQAHDGEFPLLILDLAHPDVGLGGPVQPCRSCGTHSPLVVAFGAGAGRPHPVPVPVDDTLPRPTPDDAAGMRLAEALLTRAAATAEAEVAQRLVEVLATEAPRRPAPGARPRASLPRSTPEVLRESESLYRHLFERNPQPMWVYDIETLRFLAVNEQAVERYGYSVEEFLSMTITGIRPPDELPRLEQNLRRTPSGASSRSGVWRHRTRDGRILFVEIFSHEILFGHRPARLVMAHDITERRQIEEALRESEQRYRALFDQSPLGVLQFDRHLRVVTCNPRLGAELGFSDPAGLVGFDLARIRDPRVLGTLRQALTGERASFEGPYHSLHARRHAWISLHVSPQYDADGKVQGGIAIVEDITARRRAEIRLAAQAQEMEELNARLQERTRDLEAAMQSRSRLYATLNHELRTPISAVVLYSDLLLDGAMGPLSEEQAEGVQHVQRSAQHLFELVQDVLDLARMEAGKLPVRIECISLAEMASDLVSTIRPLAAQRGSEMRLEVGEPTPALATDAKRVRQIVLNLLSNAVRFGAGRPIVVRCAALPGGGAELSVADQGCGVAPEDQPRVFEDFVQVGHHREGGSGLGLSISRRLADLLGGTLTLESELDRGSTFRLTLPATAPSAPGNPIRIAHDTTL
jgi:PAS domain S-box-containing protein